MEIELKFDVPAQAHAALRRLQPLRATRPASNRVHSIYFDTPGFELREHAMSLRLRKVGKRWVQGLKAGRSGAGGLHAREEWEVERPDATLDLSVFAQLPKLKESLGEIFVVDFMRTRWTLEPSPGNRIEVALDRGKVSREGSEEALSEVEIESLAGDPAAVFDLAEELLDGAPLRPSAITKAQRGYRLARGERPQPAKAREVHLDPGMSIAHAAQVIIASAVEHLQANDGGVLQSQDPEYLHQLRVALRRLRSAMRTFRGVLDASFEAQMRDELKWLSALTGPARDWDVLATQTVPALLEAFGKAQLPRAAALGCAARRRDTLQELRSAIASPRYARLILGFARHLSCAAKQDPSAGTALRPFAERVVRKRCRKLLPGLREASALSSAERHALRLEAKRLRYAAEGLSSLFRHKRMRRFTEALSEIQEDLGRANDAAVGQRLLAELPLPNAFAQFARGWLAARGQCATDGLERPGKQFARRCEFCKEP